MALRHSASDHGGDVCRCGEDGRPVKHGPEARDEILAKIAREKEAASEAETEEEE